MSEVLKMEFNNYSKSDILNLFYIHGECNKIISRTCRRFNEVYPNLPAMNERKFRRIERNYLNFGIVDAPRNQVNWVTGDGDNEINVLGYFYAYPHASISSAAVDLGISRTSIWRILQKHNMHDYKFIRLQALQREDPPKRVEFCEMLLTCTYEDPNFLKKIIWTDESKFSHEGIFNRRNNHFWASENPHFVREREYQQKFGFNVFCLLMDDKLSICIYEENLNSIKYLDILKTTVSEFLDNLPLNIFHSCWYQLDGAPGHCTREVSRELTNMFEDRWIRRLGPWLWPPRSPDLTPLDFYLWGKVKEEVYRTPVDTKEELENRVRRAFENIDPSEIRRATTDHVKTSILQCLQVNGHHFKHLSY